MVSDINRRRLLNALTRASLCAGAMGTAAALQRYFRIFSVGSFALASRLRSLRSEDDIFQSNSATCWRAQLSHSSSLPLRSSRGVVTYHPWYHGFRSEIIGKCLSEAAVLGATYVRTDIRWKDVLPDGYVSNDDAFEWYRDFFRAARDLYGLRSFVVLSNPPNTVLAQDASTRFKAWNRYVEMVVHQLGDVCGIFQLLNELNNPVYRVFPYKLVGTAICAASSMIRHHFPEAKIAINILVGLWGWKKRLEQILHDTSSSIDILGLDYYPGTWAFTRASNWQPIIEVLSDSTRFQLGGKSFAILETGYATNVPRIRDEQEQVNYFRQFALFLQKLEKESNTRLGLVGFYELCDADSSTVFDPEAHFGLLNSISLKRKPAFGEVERIIHLL